MTLKVRTHFPGGNAADIDIAGTEPIPEIRFASDPCGGTEALWFHFRLEETTPDPARHTKVRLTWNYFDTLPGAANTPGVIPVCQLPGQPWARLKQAEETRTPDGRRQLSWTIPHPAPSIEVACCFPYGPPEMDSLLDRARDYWQAAPIGLSRQARRIMRLFNSPGTPGGTQPGIYVIARQHSGETPGSWVLDGFLRHLSQIRKAGYVVWVVPFANIDGVIEGRQGKGESPCDLCHAWGNPATRHEARVIRHDVSLWKARCRQLLALDLHAPGAGERDGVYACVSGEPAGPLTAEETKWCNVMQHELQGEFAAPEFKRADPHRLSGQPPDFATFMRTETGVAALRIETPFTCACGNVLTQKSYREIGRRLALAIMHRNG